jgi:membrane protein
MAEDPVAKLKKLQAEAQAFLDERGIELQDQAHVSPWRRFAHFWLLVGKSFIRNRCPVRATALAYTTLLALVPLLAVVIGISTTFLKTQGEKPIQEMIDKFVAQVAPQLDLVDRTNVVARLGPGTEVEDQGGGRQEIARRILEYVGHIRSGTLGITGVVSLILVAILLLSNIEKTFNDIWGVTQGRNWRTRVVQYWAAITLGPIILLAVIAITSGPRFAATKRLLDSIPFLGKLLFDLLPFGLLITTFALFYLLMPHARVHWRAAVVGGLVGGCLWQLNNLFNVIYVSRVVTYSKIYGSFGIVPVFLVGLYFSWLILLFGAQVAYAYQNRLAYVQERQAEAVNQRGREFVALRVMTCAGDRFQRGEKAPTVPELSAVLGVPSRLISQLVQTLAGAKLLSEVVAGESAYMPARPLENITCQDVLQAVRGAQGAELATREDNARAVLRAELERIRLAEQQTAAGTTILALVQRLRAEEKQSKPGTAQSQAISADGAQA